MGRMGHGTQAFVGTCRGGEEARMRVIHVLRKPLSEGTVASNVLKHGCGGLNIDASRIGTAGGTTRSGQAEYPKLPDGREDRSGSWARTGHSIVELGKGRWPANVILQHLEGCWCDGVKRVKPSNGSGRAGAGSSGFQTSYVGGDSKGVGFGKNYYVKDDGKETVANWICEPGCPVARLDEQSGERSVSGAAKKGSRGTTYYEGSGSTFYQNKGTRVLHNDTGGASRFFKQVGGEK